MIRVFIKTDSVLFLFGRMLLLVLAVFSMSDALRAAPSAKKDYILIINSYIETTPLSKNIINPVIKMVAGNTGLDAFVEDMPLLLTENREMWNELRDRVFRKYRQHPPRVVVLIGTPVFMLRDDIRREWGDMPIVICGQKDYMGPEESYFERRAILPHERIPLTHYAQEYNMTYLNQPVYIRENIELIRRMIPQMKQLIYVGDQIDINLQNDYEIAELIKKDYPGLEYRFYSAARMTTDQLFDSLNRVDVRTTGILFSSWLQKTVLSGGNSAMMTNSHRVISTVSVPLFVFRGLGIDEDGSIVGGYVDDPAVFEEKLISVLTAVLGGRSPRDIPFYYPKTGVSVFNYLSLVQRGLSPDLLPENAVVYHRPPTFWRQYRVVLIGAGILIIAIIMFSQYRRIQMLEKLKSAQQRALDLSSEYLDLFNSMPILYMREELICDETGMPVDTKVNRVNERFKRTFASKRDAVGKRRSELFPELVVEFMHFVKISIDDSRPIAFPCYFKEIDTFFEVVLNYSNTPRMIDIFYVDSTPLHRTQEKLRATNEKLAMALEIANIVPWKWNLENRTILCDVNRPIELSSAIREIDEQHLAVPDSEYFSKIFKEDRDRIRKAYQDLIEGRTEKVKEEYRVVVTHGSSRRAEWVEAQAVVGERDRNGAVISLVGSSLVITERKKMEEELISAKDRSEESNRLKSAFLANMSHEIRTPLNAIVGFSNILASTDDEEEKQEYVSIIENNNALLLQLISDILDLSKIEAGTLDFIYTDFDLNALMKEMENTFRIRLPDDRVQLFFEPGLPDCTVHLDKNRFSQLFHNLVINAIKFTKEGTIRYGYTLEEQMLRFYVSDTGCGIPPEQQKSIFERFVKLNTFAQGSGLGLSICRTLVERMGGHIGVESELGKGSTFWFTLPYVPGTVQNAREEVFQTETVEKDKLTILVAEDHESNYKLFESILKRDYRLIHAWNGKEAVEYFERYRPHIVLMDINMPVMDGYEATREIRKLSVSVPIIAVTAFAYASDEQKVMESGFDGYLPKPINARQMKSQIADIFRNRIVLI